MSVKGIMKFLRLYSLPCLCIMVCAAFISATANFKYLGSYSTQAKIVSVDYFSNFYSAGENKFYKYSPEGAYLYPYEELRYGKIGMVDVSNPMKLLVFYPDFLTAVTLDKYLAPLSTINFLNLGYQNVSAVASSTDGKLWFYDNTAFKLKKIDETGTIFQESQALNIVTGNVPNPNFMTEKDNTLYLNDPEIGVLVFDIFGSYIKTIPLKGLTRFQVFQDQIIYFADKKLNAYNLVTLDLRSLALPDSVDVLNAAIQKDRLAILKKDKVDFYKY